MTRSDLIEHLCQARKLPKGRTEQLLDAILGSIEQALKTGDRVEIRGFGSFEVRHYEGYVGRNPRTGTTALVKPKKLPFFKVGRELRERVNLDVVDATNRTVAPNVSVAQAPEPESPALPPSAVQAHATLAAS
jgi:integration host factor subunit beta